MVAVIIGGTGFVGKILVQKLLEDPVVSDVIVVARRSCRLKSPKLKEVSINNLNQLTELKTSLNGDVYFSCLGTTLKAAGSKEKFKQVDYQAVMDLAHIAKEYNAQKFIAISALGANANSLIFYNQVKGELERDLTGLALNELVIMRPSLLIGDRGEKRFLEGMAVKTFKKLSSILPRKVSKKLGTDINQLVSKMIDEAKSSGPKIKIIESKDI